ncbi:MAG: hypothetical protein WDN04_13800 [Rhodospirillales bacterium]
MAERRLRSALADRMGFAWEPEELPDMTLDEARKIAGDADRAAEEGRLTNEDTVTILYARNLLTSAGRQRS